MTQTRLFIYYITFKIYFKFKLERIKVSHLSKTDKFFFMTVIEKNEAVSRYKPTIVNYGVKMTSTLKYESY